MAWLVDSLTTRVRNQKKVHLVPYELHMSSVPIGEDRRQDLREDHTGSYRDQLSPRNNLACEFAEFGGPAKSSFCLKERYDGKVFATHRNWNGLLAT